MRRACLRNRRTWTWTGIVLVLMTSLTLFSLKNQLVSVEPLTFTTLKSNTTNQSVRVKLRLSLTSSNKRHHDVITRMTTQVPATSGTTQRELLRLNDFSKDIFLFSAVVGNSTRNMTWDQIVLQGWEHKSFDNYNYTCCIVYRNEHIESVTMTKKFHWTYVGYVLFPVKQFICPNVRNSSGDVPVSVTLSRNSSGCHVEHHQYLPITLAYRHENQLAACTKLAYGNLAAEDLLTWFELHKLLGVDKVLTYTYELNPAATAVLEHYQALGMVESIPFALPRATKKNGTILSKIGDKNFQSWNDEQIPVYDCLEKLKGYTYLMLTDLDEYVIPRQNETLKQMFDRYRKSFPSAAGFSIWTQVHVTSWNVTNEKSRFKVGRYVNSTRPINDRLKNVVLPDRVSPGGLGTHQYTPDWGRGYKRSRIKPNDAVLHHFRPCRREWTVKKPKFSCMDTPRIVDTSVVELLQKVETNLIKLNRTLFGNS